MHSRWLPYTGADVGRRWFGGTKGYDGRGQERGHGRTVGATPATQVMEEVDGGALPISRVMGITRVIEVEYVGAGSHGGVGPRRGG